MADPRSDKAVVAEDQWTQSHHNAQSWLRNNLGRTYAMSDVLVEKLVALLAQSADRVTAERAYRAGHTAGYVDGVRQCGIDEGYPNVEDPLGVDGGWQQWSSANEAAAPRVDYACLQQEFPGQDCLCCDQRSAKASSDPVKP